MTTMQPISKVFDREPHPHRVKFSLVTNASAKDAVRLATVLPHWVRVFGGRLEEICVLVDGRPAEGRIGRLHAVGNNLDAVTEQLDRFAAQDSRLRWRLLDYARLPEVSRTWWTVGEPVRCQDGSPVFAFASALLEARGRFILRADCDMLFREDGWLEEGIRLLTSGTADMVAPPRLGNSPSRVSSRAMLVDWENFAPRFLPMRAAQLDWPRRIHRRFQGRPGWRGFEDSLLELARSGRAKFTVLPQKLGASMHVVRVADFSEPRMERVVAQWEQATIPAHQLEYGWDYLPSAWDYSGPTAQLLAEPAATL